MTNTYDGPAGGFWFDPANWSAGRVPEAGDTVDLFGSNGPSAIAPGAARGDPSLPLEGLTIDISGSDPYGPAGITYDPNYYLLAAQLGTAASPVAIIATDDSGSPDDAQISFTSLWGSLTVGAGQALVVDTDEDVGNSLTINGPVDVGKGATLSFGAASSAEYVSIPARPLTLNGPVVVDGGTVGIFASAVDGAAGIELENGGVLSLGSDLSGGSATDLRVMFGPGGGTFDTSGDLTGDEGAAISGFGAGDTIIGDDGYDGNDPLTARYADGVLTISDRFTSLTQEFPIAGDYAGDNFAVQAIGDLKFAITYQPCFAAGTRIATPAGEVDVESLAVGAQVTLAAGGAAAVIWIGHRRASACDIVRVRAGALGPRVPRRDLLLTADHALAIGDCLIPAGLLVNDTSITREEVRHATVYHLELADHAVLLAEGAPAESYLDTGNRAQFGNCPLQGDPALPGGEPCGEIVVAGRRLAAARAGLPAMAPQ